MSNKCENNHLTIRKFFHNFERTIILCFCFFSLILNIIIIISIFLTRNKKKSIVMRLTLCILIFNFISLFSYSFQWIICKEEYKTKDNNSYFIIGLLFENNINTFYVCKFQSFILLGSSLIQDYLVILFFFIVNSREIIKEIYINLYLLIFILYPIILSAIYLEFKAFGLNDDFCYVKKYEYVEPYHYEVFENHFIYYIIIHVLRGINFCVCLFLLIKIIKYLKNEKSYSYIFQKLSILFIQFFKLFIIIFYRTLSLSLKNFPEYFRKAFVILSTLDGVLIPLSFSFSNEIFANFCKIGGRRSRVSTSIDEDNLLSLTILPRDDMLKSSTNSSNNNNFDLTY